MAKYPNPGTLGVGASTITPSGGGGDLIWTWADPLGEAALRPNIKMILRENATLAAATAAERIKNDAISAGLVDGQLAITLDKFGFHRASPPGPYPIWKHPDDVISAAVETFSSVWMLNGVTAAKAYFTAFADAYEDFRLADPDNVPTPTRFLFVGESRVVPYVGDQPLVFHLMMQDSRWDTELIYGYDNKTLADLYEAAGSPSFNPDHNFSAASNKAWSKWFAAVCDRATDGAFDDVAFAKIRELWPNCKCGNYNSTVYFDGNGGKPRRLRQWEPLDFPWYQWHVLGSGSLQTPVEYWADPAQMQIELGHMKASNADAPVCPWVYSIGHYSGGQVSTLELFAAWMQAIRINDIGEFILFSSAPNQVAHWDQMLAVIDGEYVG